MHLFCHTKTFISTLIELHLKLKKKKTHPGNQDDKVESARALESESNPELTSFMALSKIFNSSLHSSVKREWKAVIAQCPE